MADKYAAILITPPASRNGESTTRVTFFPDFEGAEGHLKRYGRPGCVGHVTKVQRTFSFSTLMVVQDAPSEGSNVLSIRS